jgi:uncharacterized protein involved in exopolysaccharide biosynthesis
MRQIVTEAVFRRKRIFLLTLYLVMGLVVAAILLMHKRYEADAKLMVQNVRAQAPLTTSPSEHLMQANDVSTTEINNEVDLLQSTGVARRALGEDVEGTDSVEDEKRIAELERRLTVEAVHQSSLINLKLVAGSPEEAADQLQKVIDAFFEARAGAARSSGEEEFFDEQVQEKGRQLDADQQQLTNFEVQHQIADLDDQKKLQVTRVGDLQDQVSRTGALLAQKESSTAAERRQLSLTPSRSKTTIRTITNQYSQEHLDTELVDLENRRTELLKRYPPSDRQVVEINEKIATTQRAAVAAAQHPAGETASDVNPVYQQLSSAVATAAGDVSGIAAQRKKLEQQLKDAQTRLTELEEATTQYDALKRQLSQAQADYAVYSQKRDEARISDALDKAKMFDVALVQRPEASPQPVRPQPVLYLAAGLALALLLGTLLALYADTSAEQVYSPAQLDVLTGTRTIATFADEDEGDKYRETNRLEYRRVLVAIRSALGADQEGTGASARQASGMSLEPEEPTTGTGWAAVLTTAARMAKGAASSGHDEAVAQTRGKPAGYAVAFVSALAGEGVSFLVNNVATEAAKQASSRVAVLDMNALLRRFEEKEDVSFAMKYDATKQCWVLALNGDANGALPQRRGATHGQFSARLRPLLVEARKEFDFLFLDCPSLQASTLASELAVCVDGYVGVVAAGRARKQNLEQMAAALTDTRVPLLGYVLNRRKYVVPGWLHRLIW